MQDPSRGKLSEVTVFNTPGLWLSAAKATPGADGATLREVADQNGVSVMELMKANECLVSGLTSDKMRGEISSSDEPQPGDYGAYIVGDTPLLLRPRASIREFVPLTQERLCSGRKRDLIKCILGLHAKHLTGEEMDAAVAQLLPIVLVVDEQEDLLMLVLQYLDRRGLLASAADFECTCGKDADACRCYYNMLGNIIVKRGAAGPGRTKMLAMSSFTFSALFFQLRFTFIITDVHRTPDSPKRARSHGIN